jgi:hypothetical protein
VWLAAVLGWLTEDSGATVPAAALPLMLPLMVVILSSLPAEEERRPTAGEQLVLAGGTARSGPGAAGYR